MKTMNKWNTEKDKGAKTEYQNFRKYEEEKYVFNELMKDVKT